ncbi:N-acetyltransferase [Streptomyces sp. SID3343]|uniref:N-acetyltransferase n=1 Tax=Streptomyces sp. SID3343 TaxID=2690260 RepID=UPI00136BBAA1|nr:N-acetyltransferase [Streptomyces sp. SID3343]MYW05010.1 N-acetyltransferase [Streptomyces sp. SID3343]
MANIDLTHHSAADLGDVRPILLEVYAEVYARDLDGPFGSVAAFARRLDGYAAAPGFACAIGVEHGTVVGYAFGYPLPVGARWWLGLTDPVPAAEIAETGRRTFALNELMVRAPWRGTDAAHTIHEALVAGRAEERVTLLVDPTHPKVLALYRRWGYRVLSDLRPAWPDAPLLTVMLREPISGGCGAEP